MHGQRHIQLLSQNKKRYFGSNCMKWYSYFGTNCMKWYCFSVLKSSHMHTRILSFLLKVPNNNMHMLVRAYIRKQFETKKKCLKPIHNFKIEYAPFRPIESRPNT